ncbi:3-oxoacyl-ACP reductase FabG [Roseiterribacter gracilis]|uniref:3-ketoacyl-ACP reductase n=1 Tax=Roseiterribacter gracilis TaxID=2812848 RepID=A0A8S8X799_9PROT|nr:3-ketoacyl-ACP reductase [Rhodospirillales bacterium TMPK1]
MKRALVTGGSGAIGSAICRALAADGHHIYVHANQSLDKAQALAAELGNATAVAFDVTDGDAVDAALQTILADGPIQILVNNAGITDDAVLPGMKRAQWTRVLDVSLNGFFNVTQPLLLPMMATRWGRIVNVTSVAGIVGNRGQGNYAAAKAGLHGATKTLAIEVASRGVTVNAVAPGIIESDMTDGVFDKDAIGRLVPMKRAGKPDEVAAMIRFLTSDAASYVSGQIISVNGAMV